MPLTQDLLQDKESVLWYVNVGIPKLINYSCSHAKANEYLRKHVTA